MDPTPKRERLLSESGTWGAVGSLAGLGGRPLARRALSSGEDKPRSPGERAPGGPHPESGANGAPGVVPEAGGAGAPARSPQAQDATPSPKLFLRNTWLSAKKKRPPSMQKGLIVGSLGRDVEMSPQERRLGFQLPPSPSDPRPTAADLRKATLLRSVFTPMRPRALPVRAGGLAPDAGTAAAAPSASPEGMQMSPCGEASSPKSMSLVSLQSIEMKSSSDHSSGPGCSGLLNAACGTPCSS